MLLYTKEEQRVKKRERGRELITFCGGPVHMAAMLGDDFHCQQIEAWKRTAIAKAHIDTVLAHPAIKGHFTKDYLLALDKVPAAT